MPPVTPPASPPPTATPACDTFNPGIRDWSPAAFRELGMAAMMSRLIVCCTLTLWTSTTGDWPVTVIVSSSVPTVSSALTVATNVPVSSTPSRLTVLKPGNENVTEYEPGRRSTTRYCPVASVVTDRTFSIRAGLAASTITPGSTAPDTSLTTPVIAACARATAGNRSKTDRRATDRMTTLEFIPRSFQDAGRRHRLSSRPRHRERVSELEAVTFGTGHCRDLPPLLLATRRVGGCATPDGS